MLRQLRINNIVLVNNATVDFGDGLNVISGETGSGKSALLGALDLVLGARADTSLLRASSNKAVVEALFDIDTSAPLLQLLEDAGIDHHGHDHIVIRRELLASGKSRAFVNNQMAHVVLLKQLGNALVDLVGQHANRHLLDTATHRTMLDLYGGHVTTIDAYKKAYAHERALRAEHDTLLAGEAQRLRDLQTCRIEVEELETAALREGEDEELFSEYTIMANSEELSNTVGMFVKVLNGSKGGIIPALSQHATTWQRLEQLDPTIFNLGESYRSACIELQELEGSLRRYQSSLNYNPSRYQQVSDRLSEISRLQKKYGSTISDVLKYLDTTRQRLEELDSTDNKISDLEQELTVAHDTTNTAAATLTASRTKAAKALGKGVTEALHRLNMDKARFQVDITPHSRNNHGDDQVVFHIAPNTGEKMVPLKECASGGELSRVMLALKTLLAGKEETPTLVFDEVDGNIGGTTATVVGQQLKVIGARHQVLCITHFPQVAQQADHHIVISKHEESGRTLTRIRALDKNERQDELNRMQGIARV